MPSSTPKVSRLYRRGAAEPRPKARPETPTEPPAPATGIDYLALVDTEYTNHLAGKVNYAAFASQPPDHGQQPPAHADPQTDPTTDAGA